MTYAPAWASMGRPYGRPHPVSLDAGPGSVGCDHRRLPHLAREAGRAVCCGLNKRGIEE